MNIVIDVFPWDNPKDGDRLVRLTSEEHLLEDSGIRVELYGFGSGMVVVNKNHPDVTATNFAPGNYCRVYDLDISSTIALFGFFFEEQVFQVLSVDEAGGQVQRHGGRGVMTVLGRVVWDNYNYVTDGDPQYSPRSDGRWYWYNDQYGDILKRAIDEAQDDDRPGYATLIPWVTYDFDSTNDSNGDPWVSFTGNYSIPIGQNYIDTIQAFMDAGLIIKMDPEFLLQAFQTGGYGTDRTTLDYAADKVLFTSYVVAGDEANIVNRLPRSKKPAVQATRALVKGDSDEPSSMRHRTLAGDVSREIFVTVDGTNAPETLDSAGDQALAAREDAADTPIFKHRAGLNSLAGLYTPFPPSVGLPGLLLPRLYLSHASAGVGVRPIHAVWEGSTISQTALMTTAPNATSDSPSGDNWSTIHDHAYYSGKYVLTDTVVFTGGSVRGQAMARVRYGIGIAAQGHQSQMVLRLYDSSDVLKGTLLSPHEPGSIDSQRWANEGNHSSPIPLVNTMFPADATWVDDYGAPLEGALTGVAGDYLLLELGGRHIDGQDGAAAGSKMGLYANQASDLPAGDQSQETSGNAWIELWDGGGGSGPDGTYWVGDLVTIATGTGVGDYDYEDKRVYAINWVLDKSNTWWPMPELGPLGDVDQSFNGGGLSVGVGGSGSTGGGSSGGTSPTTVQKQLTNKSGGAVTRGDVVVVDPDNDTAFEITTVAGETRMVGVALEDILADATGWVATHGFVEFVNVTASVTRSHYGSTSTTVKKAVAASVRSAGAFCQFLTSGTIPSAWLFGAPDAAAVSIISWKQAVRVATTASGTLATSFENGDTIDGVVLATGDRILIKDQGSAENGIYVVNASGAPTRATDADVGAELVGAAVIATEGTANADKIFICTTNAPITIGVTTTTWTALSAASSLVVQEDDSTVDAAVTTLDFTTALNVTSSPSGEANVAVDLGTGATQAAAGNHAHSGSTGNLNVIIGNGVDVITTGVKAFVRMPFAGTFTRWTLMADVSGAIKIDVWKDTYTNFPPDNSDSITNANEPEIVASGTKAEDTTITNWTGEDFVEGDILGFNVDSVTSIKRVTLELKYTRS